MGPKGVKVSSLSVKPCNRFSFIPCLILAMGLSMLEKVMPGGIYTGFAYPAAYIASFFYGTQPVVVNGEILIAWNTGRIHVTPDCAGYGFFCLVWAMTFMAGAGSILSRGIIFRFLSTAALAYTTAIFTNGMRIISAYKVHELSKDVFPSNFQSALHLGVGIAVFLPVLIVVFLIMERRGGYERSPV